MTSIKSIAKAYDLNYLGLPFEVPTMPCSMHYPQRLKFDGKNMWLRKVCRTVLLTVAKDLGLKVY